MSHFNYSSDCLCGHPRSTPKDTLPPSYYQLGGAKTLDDVRQLFRALSGLDASQIGVTEIFWTRESQRNQCRPFSNILPVVEEEKIVVLVKRQICSTELHNFTVVAILIKDILKTDLLKIVKNSLYEHILPVVKYLPRGRTDKILDCKCNFGEIQGGSKTFGCSAHISNKSKCKFNKRPADLNKGWKKFNLWGKPVVSDPNLESLTNLLADIASHSMCKYAPLSFSNMLAHSKNAPSCCIGQQFPSIFGGVTIVSDYTAHSHRDIFDYSSGAVAIFSFTNSEKKRKAISLFTSLCFPPQQ